MFDHVTLHASDIGASSRFYRTVLGPADGWREFRLVAADPAGATRGLHIAFVTRSRAEVDAWWRAGVEAGYDSDGEPGPRPIYSAEYYGGFLLDPDGNSSEAVYHGRERAGPCIVDHLWIRVAELDASHRFWEAVGSPLGLTIYGERPERFHVGARDRSFALVADGRPVTENVELAFPAAEIEAVERAAHEAGYEVTRPGRVLDPDGNTIAIVTPPKLGAGVAT